MRLKTLNGAPLAEQLDFAEALLLPESECDAFHVRWRDDDEDQNVEVKWRRVTPRSVRLRSGWSQPYLPQGSPNLDELDAFHPQLIASQLTSVQEGETTEFTELATELTEPSAVNDFMLQSFAFHDTLLSSQIAQDADGDHTVSSSSFVTTSFGSTTVDVNSPRPSGMHPVLHVAPTISVTPFAALPTAPHLRSIYPQTPTPNFVCVLVKPIEHKELVIRKGGYRMNLYDLTVADDTTPTFRVSFWVRPSVAAGFDQTVPRDELRGVLDSISVGSILLLRNIALTSFRDVVYGQSLKPSITRARTMVDILSNADGSPVFNIETLPTPIVEAFTKIKRWARSHIAANDGHRKRKGSEANNLEAAKRQFAKSDPDEYLPPDTMESI